MDCLFKKGVILQKVCTRVYDCNVEYITINYVLYHSSDWTATKL